MKNIKYAFKCHCYNVRLCSSRIKVPNKVTIKVTDDDVKKYGYDAMDNVIKDALQRKFGCEVIGFDYYPY